MSETPPAAGETAAAPAGHTGHDEHHDGPSMQTFYVVFGALLAFTVVSFIANTLSNAHVISTFTSFVIILGVALCKATLVALYFMHLIVDWRKVFITIVPALVLGPMLMVVLLPDIVLAWKRVIVP
ncbi:MAG: cytochrome C oxidase subunit IV family protein [Planctomycetia bacterium]|nr:cytochrome C oxidase subunit IV family protein [Planctomycetia bacterium]